MDDVSVLDTNGIGIQQHTFLSDEVKIITTQNTIELFSISSITNIKLHNIMGELVSETKNNQNYTNQSIIIQTNDISSGTYIIEYKIRDEIKTKKIIIR